MKEETKFVGELKVGEQIDITDPCYDKDVWCRMKYDMVPGNYMCYVSTKDCDVWGTRVSRIGICLDGKTPARLKEIGEIGVDAGMAGFFNNKPDYSDDEWREFCEGLGNEDFWIREDCFFSDSGYGDGMYPVYAKFAPNSEKAVALEIRFM